MSFNPERGFTLPPAWLFLIWIALALASWPVIRQLEAHGKERSIDDLAASATAYRAGRYAEAVSAAQRYLDRNPDSADALANIGIAQARLNHWDEAISATHRALLIRPDFQLAWANLRAILAARSEAKPTAEWYQARAMQLYQAGDYRGCQDQTGRALHLYAQYTRAFNLLSVCDLNLGQYDDAIRHAREALRVEPGFRPARDNLALALRRQTVRPVLAATATADDLLASSLRHYRAGQMQQCVDDARTALKLQPDQAIAWNNIAACSNDLGRHDDAIRAATEALRLRPDFQLARNNLAVALEAKQRQAP